MKHKNLFIRLVGVLVLIFFIIIFFLFYLVPTLKSINLYKRQLKDLNLKIADFVRSDETFSFSDEREKHVFTQIEQEFKAKFPKIRTGEELVDLFTKISDYFQTLAAKEGILNLVVKPGFEEPGLKTGMLSNGEKNVDRFKTTTAQRGVGKTGFASLVKNTAYHMVTLNFTGELKNAMNFINLIPQGDYYLNISRIYVSAGNRFPDYLVFLRFYFIDTGGLTAPADPGQHIEKKDEGLVIDYHSEVLLNRILPEQVESFPKKILDSRFGTHIFSKEKSVYEKRSAK